jgi:L-gulonolactone oxidase
MQVTLSLEPRFKRSITNDFRDDATLEEDFKAHALDHEFADITWYPSQHKAVYRQDDRAPLNSSGNGVNDFVGFRSTLVVASTGVRSTGRKCCVYLYLTDMNDLFFLF